MEYTLSTVHLVHPQLGMHPRRYLLLYPGKIAQVRSCLLTLARFMLVFAAGICDDLLSFVS